MERRGINHYHIVTFHARLTHHQHPCVCGILPKNCCVVPSPLDTQTALCDTWHRSFHLDISHPEFFSADIPPKYLTSGILLRQHSTWISHIRNSIRPTFHLLWIFRSRRLPLGKLRPVSEDHPEAITLHRV